MLSLNPFGTGQCLTIVVAERAPVHIIGLNPFGTGQCLTTQ